MSHQSARRNAPCAPAWTAALARLPGSGRRGPVDLEETEMSTKIKDVPLYLSVEQWPRYGLLNWRAACVSRLREQLVGWFDTREDAILAARASWPGLPVRDTP